MCSRTEIQFWSCTCLTLLCFKGIKRFQSKIRKINSYTWKNGMLLFKSCRREAITASKYFWHLRLFPCHVIHEAEPCWNLQVSKWQYKRHEQKFASLNTHDIIRWRICHSKHWAINLNLFFHDLILFPISMSKLWHNMLWAELIPALQILPHSWIKPTFIRELYEEGGQILAALSM